MPQKALFEWEGREYEQRERTPDWYWALGIIALACIAAAVLLGNYLFAVVIVAAAAAIAIHAAKEPPVHRFRVFEDGLAIGEELYHFDRMVSFCVLEDIESESPPLLSVHTEYWLAPHLRIPLVDVDADAVYAHFLTHVDESAHRPTFVDMIASWLGF